jgi:serine/threonine-protein kinase RsbT
MDIESGSLLLKTNGDIVACRQALRHIAKELGFSVIGSIALVASVGELACNALSYGGGGRVTWEVRREEGKVGVRMIFEAHGPPVPVTGRASRAREALRAAKRLVHEFAYDTDTETGGRVIVTCWR